MRKLWISTTMVAEMAGTEEGRAELSSLPVCRLKQAEAYRFEQDRLRCLGAGILIQRGLEQSGIVLNDSGQEVIERISRNPWGKPVLESGKIHFNVSHSGEYVVAVFDETPCGVDIQKIDMDILELKSFFRAQEWRWIQQADPVIRANRLWTIKESYIKYRGVGLDTAIPDLSWVVTGQEGKNEVLFTEESGFRGYFCTICQKHLV